MGADNRVRREGVKGGGSGGGVDKHGEGGVTSTGDVLCSCSGMGTSPISESKKREY